MKKVLVDLDVVTVGTWDSGRNGDLARGFMKKISDKEFLAVTPFLLLERISKWKDIRVSAPMKEFYVKNSSVLLTDEDVRQKLDEVSEKLGNFNEARLLKDLRMSGVGNQDAFLVLIAAIFELDLVTFNRKTLRSKKGVIDEVTGRQGIKAPKLVGPEKVASESSNFNGSLCLAPLEPFRSDVALYFVSELYKPFSSHLFRIFGRKLIFFHDLKYEGCIYKPFHSGLFWDKGVYGKLVTA